MIHTDRPVLATDGGRPFDAYAARPAEGRGPGLLIFTEMWGLAPSKTEMADDWARRGWSVLVPNVFWRSAFTGVVGFDEADKAWQRLQAFDFDQSAEDAKLAAQWLRAQPSCTGKVAAIGFCMGGRVSFLAGSRAGIDAAVSLYALGIAKHLDEVRTIATPLQLHYGLNDQHIPRSEIDAVTEAAKDNDNVAVHLYPGATHGFFTAGRPAYHAEAVALATTRIERLLDTLR